MDRHLAILWDRYQDGTLDAQQTEDLLRAVQADPLLLEQCLAQQRFDNGISAALADPQGDAVWRRTQQLLFAPSDSAIVPAILRRRRRQRIQRRRRSLTAAAGVMAAAVLALFVWWMTPVPDQRPVVLAAQLANIDVGQRLSPGDAVEVGDSAGEATLRFADGTTLRLFAGTRLRLNLTAELDFHCSRGGFQLQGPDHPHAQRRFTTPHLAMRIIGTDVTVHCDEQRSRVRVDKGRVAVRRLSDGRSTELSAGEQVDSDWPSLITPPPPPVLDGVAQGPRTLPAEAGIIDLSQPPYSADPSGSRDLAPILQRALEDYAGTLATLFLPAGRYRLEQGVRWTDGTPGPTLMGAGAQFTELFLPSHQDGFADASAPRRLLDMGTAAAALQRSLGKLSIHIGDGNQGAIALRYNAHHGGLLSDVVLHNPDGRAHLGLELSASELGPLLVRRLAVEGFATGIFCDALNSVTMADITLSNQGGVGIRIAGTGNPLIIDGLRSRNAVSAIHNGIDGSGHLTLLNADLAGGASSAAAIEHRGLLYTQNLRSSGYGSVIHDQDQDLQLPGGRLEEWQTPAAIAPPGHTAEALRHSRPQAASPPWPSAWRNWHDYQNAQRSDAQALQAAIDATNAEHSGVVVPFIAHDRWQEMLTADNERVDLRGACQYILGGSGTVNGRLVLRTTDASETMVIERLRGDELVIEHHGPGVLVLDSVHAKRIVNAGPGTLFLDNVSCDELVSTHSQAQTWVRQLASSRGITTQSGTVEVLGWRFEGAGTRLRATGGSTAVYGCLLYSTGIQEQPVFYIDNAAVSIAGFREVNFHSPSMVETFISEQTPTGTFTVDHATTWRRQWSLYRSAGSEP